MADPFISVCLITKDEEDFIERCLRSVLPIASELVIVDTGSTDGTIEICKTFGTAPHSYKWNNHFAEARNYGLSKAKGDWILWVDADEEIEGGHDDFIMGLLSETDAHMLLLPVINYYGETLPVLRDQAHLYYQPRLFRNHLGVEFVNNIHETPLLPKGVHTERATIPADVPIHHYGYIKEVTERKNKSQRNLQSLLAAYEDPDHSPWIEYHLASELYRLKDYPASFAYVNQSILGFLLLQLKPPSLLYRLKYALLLETNSLDGAEAGIDKALALYPDYVDLHFLKGLILIRLEKYREALAAFERCLALGENHREYLITRGAGSFNALHYKQLCLQKLTGSNK